jgi:uncharacterized membrane protein YeiH
VVAVITAIGGGTVRDVLLDRPPRLLDRRPGRTRRDQAATAATILYGRIFEPTASSLLVADAFGLALFTFIGAQRPTRLA